MSPQIRRGINIPVDSFAPYAMARPVTISAAIPFTPAFATPNKNEEIEAIRNE